MLESFKKTNRAVVVEEGWKSFGVGSEIASRIYEEAFDYVDAPIKRVAQDEVPLPITATWSRKLCAGERCGGGSKGGSQWLKR